MKGNRNKENPLASLRIWPLRGHMLTLLRLPLTPHCCRLAPHQLPPSSAICREMP